MPSVPSIEEIESVAQKIQHQVLRTPTILYSGAPVPGLDSATVYINGFTCPIVGRVSMDSIAVNVSDVEKVSLGDEVVLWGAEHPIDILAGAANTITYELMTSIRGHRTYS